MKKSDEKRILCNKHRQLLEILARYGRGAMLLSQLRAICLAVHLYPSGQAVNRAVRALRSADVLTRQTWVDGNSDLVVARKAFYEFFANTDSQGVATPPRPATMQPYIAQARKVDWLLSMIGAYQLDGLEETEQFLRSCGSTLFLRQTELLDYFLRYHQNLSENKTAYDAELRQLKARKSQQEGLASHLPFPTVNRQPTNQTTSLERMHRRGIYITCLSPSRKTVYLALFPERRTSAKKVMDWALDACWWVRSLLPGYRVKLTLCVLDGEHGESLKRALTAQTHGQSYWHARAASQRIDGMLRLSVRNSDFVNRWCGGVHAL